MGEDGNPALVVKLEGEEMHLDDLQALAALVVGDEKGSVDSLAFSHDLDVALKTDQFSGFDIEAGGVDAQFQLKGGELSIARLNAEDLFGVKLTSAGQIKNMLSAPEGNLTLQISAGNPCGICRGIFAGGCRTIQF